MAQCWREARRRAQRGDAVNAREEILRRLRTALGPDPVAPEVPRDYRRDDDTTPAERLETFVDRLLDYKAGVTRCAPADVGTAVAGALAGAGRLVTPPDVPGDWLSGYPGVVVTDDGLSVTALDE